MTDEGLALVRNPHFSGWSPAAQPDGYVNRIEWTFGVEPDAQVEDVIAGDADIALDASLSDRFEQILVQYAGQVQIRRRARPATPRSVPECPLLTTSRCDGR